MPAVNHQSPTLTLIEREEPASVDAPKSVLVPGELLGEGGMGRVLAAIEPILERSVALKTLREPSPDNRASLLREAKVLAQLEHPNILPVYGVVDLGGDLAIVLKRVQGRQWSETIATADTCSNIEILLKVMDAVGFAHSRGFLHRDLKPSNVMLGEFGEVYLMDWGLALRTRESAAVFCASGSPPYMAPEMLRPQEQPIISERTDIYLLGAILYQLLVGHPPHIGDSRSETVGSIERSEPSFPAGQDMELVAICQRALLKNPDARFQCVEEFARALRDYLAHQSSRSLLRRANGLAALLVKAVHDSEIDRLGVYEVFGPCRFAFQEAQRGWPQNAEARLGLMRCTELVARYELQKGEAATALRLLMEVGIDSGELVDRAEKQILVADQARSAAANMLRQADRRISLDARRRAVVGLGLGWTLLPIVLELTGPSHLLWVFCTAAFLFAWMAIGLVGRAWVLSSSVNRQTYGLVLVGALTMFLASMGMYQIGLPLELGQPLIGLHFFGVSAAVVFLVEWRVWPATLGHVGAVLVSMHDPAMSMLLLSASNGMLAANALLIGREREALLR